MTADEIRRDLIPTHSVMPATLPALVEIAAQLAELNATLRSTIGTERGINVALCASNDTIPVMLRDQ